MEKVSPELIYHYTSNEALVKIVTSSSIRASDAEYLNDAQEMLFGRNRLRDELKELDSLLTGKNEARARFVRASLDSLERRMTMFTAVEYYATFVSCFCDNGDLLSQWRGYGAGGGVAIGFNRKTLRKARHSGGSTQLVRVRYGKSAIKRMIDGILPEFGALATEDSQGDEDDDASNPYARATADGYFATAHQLFPALARIKDAAFSEEREWRLLTVARTKGEQYRSGKHGLVPFIDLSFPKHAISEVVIGPGGNSDLRMRGVRRLLGNHGPLAPRVRLSTAPFRG
ncbi:hypothetical protein FB565_002931 [Actinoplanes lutulentus]|uniref:DUF2971 family protein n=1 Tax=Actinoplanes lutulentus TaxID=1287878 RepID=A0A327Z2P3_9ACTN|nr:DUF2971 domain-containing protein [Actinoplanes lutulentus]MBB2943218.1 hypothetical protein [Actinoplanes lutulentus]RAK28283.1 Protein of unknown function (DUF2971) [Actinoplanes lutulentus]